jgi:hypothetical protein
VRVRTHLRNNDHFHLMITHRLVIDTSGNSQHWLPVVRECEIRLLGYSNMYARAPTVFAVDSFAQIMYVNWLFGPGWSASVAMISTGTMLPIASSCMTFID